MMMKAINTPSMIHSFLRLGINFLKIRSETKAITATKKEKNANIPDTSTCSGGFLYHKYSTAVTRARAETMFNGVSFTFNYLLFLNFFFFQAGCLFVLFLAAAAIAAACFFS